MKKLFLAVVAVLVLATGTTQATFFPGPGDVGRFHGYGGSAVTCCCLRCDPWANLDRAAPQLVVIWVLR
jgi:hypothetical protein